jgi:glutamate racemase
MKNKVQGKIGVFDSGLGGLVILKALHKKLPKYHYEYYGDTKNLPYGDKSQREIFDFTVKGIEYLISQGCILVIIACNTASAKSLRKIQQQWLPKHAPHVKVLGVIVPTIESLKKPDFPVVLIATTSTVKSRAYQLELNKLFSDQKLTSLAMPKLVPLIERGQLVKAAEGVYKQVANLPNINKSILLGCTHYPLIAPKIRKLLPNLKIIDQTEIIPISLSKYLRRHQAIRRILITTPKVNIHFTKNSVLNKKLARTWF